MAEITAEVMALIFIGGIHGVGKTYFCNRILEELNIKFYSASKLISELKKEPFNQDKLTTDIKGNQNYLVSAIMGLDDPGGLYLLDGHFCLLNEQGEVEKVPIEVFEELPINAIVVLYDSVDCIIDRLRQRDGSNYDNVAIATFQNKELEYAREVAAVIGCPFLKIDNSSSTERNIKQIKVLIDLSL